VLPRYPDRDHRLSYTFPSKRNTSPEPICLLAHGDAPEGLFFRDPKGAQLLQIVPIGRAAVCSLQQLHSALHGERILVAHLRQRLVEGCVRLEERVEPIVSNDVRPGSVLFIPLAARYDMGRQSWSQDLRSGREDALFLEYYEVWRVIQEEAMPSPVNQAVVDAIVVQSIYVGICDLARAWRHIPCRASNLVPRACDSLDSNASGPV
jgi:hypothetical protein